MMRLFPRTVRGRLGAALGLLSLAIVCISLLTWISLQRVDARLQELHRQSLSQVAQAISLSKRSSDLATAAPYLLNQRSNYLIEQEGRKLLDVLDQVSSEWATIATSETDRDALVSLTVELQRAIRDLVGASQSLDTVQSLVRDRVAVLSTLREEVTSKIEESITEPSERLIWWTLQSMNADALNAAYANNLLGVGEEQRHYQRQGTQALFANKTPDQIDYLQNLDRLVYGQEGVFELRRRELGFNLDAQNALFRIRRDANSINELAGEFAVRAEEVLSQERSSSSNTIQITRLSVAAISLSALALALSAALYVSRYVAHNVGRVSEAMVRLANGDRSSVLPRKLGGDDEIGDLFRSFRSFRANALRLDRSNRQLDQRNALFEKVFANITDGIAITDNLGRLTASNPAFQKILAVEDVRGSFVDWLFASPFGASAQEEALSVEHRGHLVLTGDNGQILEIRASKLPDEGRVWLISDVTEQRKIAERFEQIDRIELMGKLAGDTAHDFSSILSVIRTHAHLLNNKVPDETDNISAIENAVEYGASLTDRLLAFARKQPLSPEVFDLNALVEGMADLVEISLKTDVSLEVETASAPLFVKADPGQLESAILNLVLNANNAIDDGGTIRIELRKSGHEQAEITVSDTGVGMPPNIQKKAIEPFFTTRAGVGGTGLGLSIVYGFINQSGGNLEIDSREGFGTSVRVSLPLATDTIVKDKVLDLGPALVIDDNKADQALTAKVLEKVGYQVIRCSSPSIAKRELDETDFQLIVSDFDLGDTQNGLQMLQYAQKALPEADFILISGKAIQRDLPASGITFIEKPLTSEKLANVSKIAT